MASYASVQNGEWDDGSTWGGAASASMILSFDELPLIDDTGRHTITNNNVTATTTNAKWISAGRFSSASSAYLNTSTGDDFDWDDNVWTVHWWMYTHTVPNDAGIWSNGLEGGTLSEGINCCFGTGGSSTLRMYLGGTGYIIQTTDGFTGGPNHVAVVNDGSFIRVYKNGTEVLYGLGPHNSSAMNIVTPTTDFVIGRFYSNQAGFNMDTTIDEFVVAKGAALWTTDFTPPTAPGLGVSVYPDTDSDTATITHTVTYSISADVELGQIDIDSGGTLSFNPSADTLMSFGDDYININDEGTLSVGTSAVPIHKDYTAKLSWNPAADNTSGIYGYDFFYLNIYGDPDYYGADEETFTANDCTGSLAITAMDDMSSKWNVGDEIAIYKNKTGVAYNDCIGLTSITGFNGNIIECADAISSDFLAGGIICNLSRNVMFYKEGYDGSVNTRNTLRPQFRGSNASACNINDCSFAGFYQFYQLTLSATYPSRFTRVVSRNGFYFQQYAYYTNIDGGVVFSNYNALQRNTYGPRVNNLKIMGVSYSATYLTNFVYWLNCHFCGFVGTSLASIHHTYENCSIQNGSNFITGVNKSKFINCYINNGTYGTNNSLYDVEFINCEFGWDEFGNSRPNTYDLGYNSVYCIHLNTRAPDGGWNHRDRNSVATEGRHSMENVDGVLGAHVVYDIKGTITKVDADGSGSRPTQRTNGNDTISEISTLSSCGYTVNVPDGNKRTIDIIDNQQFYLPTDLQMIIRYYVQTDYTGGLSSEEIYLTAEYTSSGDTTISEIQSIQSIAIRSNQSDWSQYVDVTVNPTNEGWVRLTLEVGAYESGKYIWIDPKPEVV